MNPRVGELEVKIKISARGPEVTEEPVENQEGTGSIPSGMGQVKVCLWF